MVTNDLKKGDRVQLRNGWFATVADKAKGNTRMCTVEGFCTETGSVYSHDIMRLVKPGPLQTEPPQTITHTPAQLNLKKTVDALF